MKRVTKVTNIPNLAFYFCSGVFYPYQIKIIPQKTKEKNMAIALRELVLTYIDEALDIDDLETMGDFINSVIKSENVSNWQLPDVLRRLHADLSEALQAEKDRIRRARIKSAITHYEADFSDLLIIKETESLVSHR